MSGPGAAAGVLAGSTSKRLMNSAITGSFSSAIISNSVLISIDKKTIFSLLICHVFSRSKFN